MSFELKTSSQQLTGNKAVDQKYDIILPTRDISDGTSFGLGELSYKFYVNSDEWIDLSKSFFRVDCSLTKANGSQLEYQNQIAMAPSTVACCIDSYRMNLNQRTINRIDDHVAQIDMYHQRKTKGKTWLDSVGQVNNYEADFETRVNKVVSDPHEKLVHIQQYEGLYNNLSSSPAIASPITFQFNAAWTNNGSSNSSNFSVVPGGFQCNSSGYYKFSISYSAAATAAPAEAILSLANNPVAVILHNLNTRIEIAASGEDISGCVVGNILCAAGTTYFPQMAVSTGTIVVSQLRVNIWDSEPNLITTPDAGVPIQSLAWKPPSSLFHCSNNEVPQYLPCGEYEIILKPNDDYAKRAVQSVGNKTPGIDYKFQISACNFYLKRMKGPRVTDTTYYIDMYEYSCQQRLAGNSTSLTPYQFTVSPGTYEMALAAQSKDYGANSAYPASLYITATNKQNSITKQYVEYAGQTQPPQSETQGYTAGTSNLMTSHYIESYMISNDDEESALYYTSAGPESPEDYLKRGAFMSLPFKKDEQSKETNARAFVQFGAAPANDTYILLFSKYRTTAIVEINNGQVTNVRVA